MSLVKTAIYMTPAGHSKLQIPVNPEKIQIGSKARFVSYDTIGLGGIKIHSGREPLEVSWSGMFPGEAKKNQPYVLAWSSPESLISVLQKYRDSGTVITLSITGTNISGQFYIDSFKGKYSGGYGDFDYDIKLIEYREIKIYTTKELKRTSSKKPACRKPSKPTAPTKNKTTTYTIKKGDTLWSIATRFLKKGSRYTEIYKLNKNALEKAAKKHGRKSSNNGWWIYPGTKITIPKK